MIFVKYIFLFLVIIATECIYRVHKNDTIYFRFKDIQLFGNKFYNFEINELEEPGRLHLLYQGNVIEYQEIPKNDRFYNEIYLSYKDRFYRPIEKNLLVFIENYNFDVSQHKRIVMYKNYRDKYFLFIEYI